MKTGLIVLVVLVIIALMLGSSFISRRNQMVVKREAVNAAWAQVDVVLQRRAGPLPNPAGTGKRFSPPAPNRVRALPRAPSAPLRAHSAPPTDASNRTL